MFRNTLKGEKERLDLQPLDASSLGPAKVVGKVYRLLMEIESRALPMGLHQVGVPPSAEESVATLVNIAQLDRPDMGIKGLPRIIAESRNKDIEA